MSQSNHSFLTQVFTPTRVLCSAFLLLLACICYCASISRVSRAGDGDQGNDNCVNPVLNGTGDYIAFVAYADNLVPGDNNGLPDIFLYDRTQAILRCISVTAEGKTANGQSCSLSISNDGQLVAFASAATNLVPEDTNDADDIFIYDRLTGRVSRESLTSQGLQANGICSSPSLSANGKYMAFVSSATNLVDGDTNGVADIFVRDLTNVKTSRVSIATDGSEAIGASSNPCISLDGRYIAFASTATNLVNGDTNGKADVFVYDRQTGKTERINISSAGNQADDDSGQLTLSISSDGRYVAFLSDATNLVADDTNTRRDIFLHDRTARKTTRIVLSVEGHQLNGSCYEFSINANAEYIAFKSDAGNIVPGDNNNVTDVFIRDIVRGKTLCISVSENGAIANNLSSSGWGSLSISADGQVVAFSSFASNLVRGDTNDKADIFVWEQPKNNTIRPSHLTCITNSPKCVADNASGFSAINADGRYIVFSSMADNLVPGDTNGKSDIFLYDRVGGEITIVSAAPKGIPANNDSLSPAISADGNVIAFTSFADNLMAGDWNHVSDVFVFDRPIKQLKCISINNDGKGDNGNSRSPALSADGHYLVYISYRMTDDLHETYDVLLYDREIHRTVCVNTSWDDKQANGPSRSPAISADGRYIAFWSMANNIVKNDTNNVPDIFVRDMQTGITERVSVDNKGAQANDASYDSVSISADGRLIAFSSYANNLVPDDTNNSSDIFLFNRETKKIQWVSLASNGTQGNAGSYDPIVSADGTTVVFTSLASNLAQGDLNYSQDVFAHYLTKHTTSLVSMNDKGIAGNSYSDRPCVNSNGQYICFTSDADDLVADDKNGVRDIFLVEFPP